jgi:hypothetical protein
MLFSVERNEADIQVEYGEEARVSVVPHERDNVLIRVPGWAPRESVTLRVDNQLRTACWIGPYLFVGRDLHHSGSRITVTYALPEHVSTETMRNGKTYQFTWRGDQVVASDPPTPIYPA